jgi:parvulin-like peptidyl-prolyl isomerase
VSLITPCTLASLVLALLTSSCVLTTNESASEPPRGAVQPIWPPLGEPPATPMAEGEHGRPSGEEGTTAARPETIVARHILVQHRGALRASENITRSKAEARARAEEALHRARAGEDFAKLVIEYSDEPGAGSRGGMLPRFARGVMAKEFEKAAFALEPGQISEVVETPFGFHVIQRTE